MGGEPALAEPPPDAPSLGPWPKPLHHQLFWQRRAGVRQNKLEPQTAADAACAFYAHCASANRHVHGYLCMLETSISLSCTEPPLGMGGEPALAEPPLAHATAHLPLNRSHAQKPTILSAAGSGRSRRWQGPRG